ncbi:MAG: response regulator [Candidatus Marinimicrobia bacterium]|jgi:DNA-binding NtrC family response regulator|nr:response regulator [Candidatus Neomarinimicrobiota bacterium]MBT3633700.1 response regulator [Candidatus Neomarinimicrobiota bacterium]MBT3682347.1 response regulator [Candidatus Neomarinimicrobiota bacterium]MBT3759111.1 response regulator [Candidatus Neomarinimicrobiota bacterium]MBT3895616.1 response regulator [Candidatus Neomarinimicrobiota bacterium]
MSDIGQTGKTILIVDDDDTIVRVLEYEFKSMGWEVHVSFNGLDAYKLAIKVIPDVMLSDIKMPGMSGIELSHKISKEIPDILIILMTGNQNLSTAIEVLRGPVYDFYEKPYKIEHLVLNIEKGMKMLDMKKNIQNLENQLELLKARVEDISGPLKPMSNAMLERSTTFEKIRSQKNKHSTELYKKHEENYGDK